MRAVACACLSYFEAKDWREGWGGGLGRERLISSPLVPVEHALSPAKGRRRREGRGGREKEGVDGVKASGARGEGEGVAGTAGVALSLEGFLGHLVVAAREDPVSGIKVCLLHVFPPPLASSM